MIKQILVLVEGQTEEKFVKQVLAPHFKNLDCYIVPTILNTRIMDCGPNYKGGVSKFSKIKKDLNPLLKFKDALVTTIIDFYARPKDIPGTETLLPTDSSVNRVKHVEKSVEEDLKNPRNLLVFFALHEYEAWLFSSPSELPQVMAQGEKEIDFQKIINEFRSPEEINERPGFSPSKRIESLFPTYEKTSDGPKAANRIGLEKIREKCFHFNEWIEKLEEFAKE